MTDENITADTLPGHDPVARVNGAGPHDPFDADAPDTPERAAVEQRDRILLLEEQVAGQRAALALLAVTLAVGLLIAALYVARARKARA